jgi:hypothetical protein
LFVNCSIVTVQANIRAGAVGIAFEDDVGIRRNAEKGSEHLGEDLGLEVFQRELEAPITVIVQNLDSNQVLWSQGGRWCCHDQYES